MNDQSSLTCNLGALTAPEQARRSYLARVLRDTIEDVTELPDGLAIRLGVGVGLTDALREFVEFERRCCPFLDIKIHPGLAASPAILELRGPEGVKQFLAERFPSVRDRRASR